MNGFLILAFLLMLSWLPAQEQLISNKFVDLEALNESNPRNSIIFIHTDWCKYCHKMEHTTFQNDSVIHLLNEHFYYISFNAESKDSIHFMGQTFQFEPNGSTSGVHQLAKELGSIDGKTNYPTLCILSKNYEIIFQYAGYLNSDELVNILNKASD